MKLLKLLDKPKVIAVISDVNCGKSNLLYWIVTELRKTKQFNLYTYGLRKALKDTTEIFTIEELEVIKDSLIILDEVMTLWDLDNRKLKKQIENTLRLIHHNNNILIISAIPENIKKFISGKISVTIYKKVTFEDFINGSTTKAHILNYRGKESGSKVLSLKIDEALIYDGHHYELFKVPYMRKFDTKLKNKPIFSNRSEKRAKSVRNNVLKAGETIKCAKSVPKEVDNDLHK